MRQISRVDKKGGKVTNSNNTTSQRVDWTEVKTKGIHCNSQNNCLLIALVIKKDQGRSISKYKTKLAHTVSVKT